MRRELKFKTFDDARAELSRLGNSPVATTGSWSYFQILTHLAKAIEGSMKGVKREMPWLKKYVLGPLAFQGMWVMGSIPIGIKGPPSDRVEGDEKEALAQLLKAMGDFEKHEGPLSEHPKVGRLNKVNWTRFHTLHIANHLGYTKE